MTILVAVIGQNDRCAPLGSRSWRLVLLGKHPYTHGRLGERIGCPSKWPSLPVENHAPAPWTTSAAPGLSVGETVPTRRSLSRGSLQGGGLSIFVALVRAGILSRDILFMKRTSC